MKHFTPTSPSQPTIRHPVGVSINPVGVYINPVGVPINPEGVSINPIGVTINPVMKNNGDMKDEYRMPEYDTIYNGVYGDREPYIPGISFNHNITYLYLNFT